MLYRPLECSDGRAATNHTPPSRRLRGTRYAKYRHDSKCDGSRAECERLTAKKMRSRASHPRPPMRHGLHVSRRVASLPRSAQSNGDEPCVLRSCALLMVRTRRNALEPDAREKSAQSHAEPNLPQRPGRSSTANSGRNCGSTRIGQNLSPAITKCPDGTSQRKRSPDRLSSPNGRPQPRKRHAIRSASIA
jgi:hypothetical protein